MKLYAYFIKTVAMLKKVKARNLSPLKFKKKWDKNIIANFFKISSDSHTVHIDNQV